MSSTPHNRASLLAGLRTGGVRSASATHPRFVSHLSDEDELLHEMPSQSVFVNSNPLIHSVPATAAVDGSNTRFARQQAQLGLNPNSVPFSPTPFSNQNQLQNQAFQMQLLQLEMMRIQSQVCLFSLISPSLS